MYPVALRLVQQSLNLHPVSCRKTYRRLRYIQTERSGLLPQRGSQNWKANGVAVIAAQPPYEPPQGIFSAFDPALVARIAADFAQRHDSGQRRNEPVMILNQRPAPCAIIVLIAAQPFQRGFKTKARIMRG